MQEGHPFTPPPQEPKSRQEENWRMMTILQMPWRDAESIEDESDRKFLLEKAVEVETFLQSQQAQHMMQQQSMGDVVPSPQAGQPQVSQPQVEIVKP
jgi:hypothetical protein